MENLSPSIISLNIFRCPNNRTVRIRVYPRMIIPRLLRLLLSILGELIHPHAALSISNIDIGILLVRIVVCGHEVGRVAEVCLVSRSGCVFGSGRAGLLVIRFYLESIEGQGSVFLELVDAEARTARRVEELIVGIKAGGKYFVDACFFSRSQIVFIETVLSGCHVSITVAHDHHVLAVIDRLAAALLHLPITGFGVIIFGPFVVGKQGDAHGDGLLVCNVDDLAFVIGSSSVLA